jgi:predicted ribonuclease YlaK
LSKKFYDTCALLAEIDNENLFKEKFFISSISLHELEHIKTSCNKDNETKYKARKLSRLLDEHFNDYITVVYNNEIGAYIKNELNLDATIPDNQIVGTAKYIQYSKKYFTNEYEDLGVIFVTNDICLKNIARTVDLDVCSVKNNLNDTYKGFKDIFLNENDMAYFYEHLTENTYDLLVNEYLILKDITGNIVDKFRWDGYEYQNVKFPTIKSNYFGLVKPYNGDIYQQMVLNSLSNNQLTMIKGAAGTGKSYLAVGYLMWLLEKRKIEKIIVFCNTVATANSAKLGYYPGSKDEKLLDSAIGNMLSAKLGDSFVLEQMISQGKIQLLPMSDIRGFDTNGMNAGIYITEAQNMDISLMKLALQRIGDDSICIIDGDYNAQVDLNQYAGNNNGMRRMSEVFRGQDFYGEIELQNIYRGRISRVAEDM